MELRQLELLLTVIECGGYAPAGKRLNVSHSAIHRQIRLLEQELGCRLLARSGSKMQPTAAARLLAGVDLNIRRELSDARCRLDDLNNLRQGCLRIGTTSSVLVCFLPLVLRRFSRKYPGVRLHLVTGVADDLMDGVLEEKLDLAIVFNALDTPFQMPNLACETLYTEEFCWAVGKRHALAKCRRIDLARLAAHPLITLPPRSHLRRACDRLFAATGVVPTVVTEVENEEAIDKLIEIGMGFALRSRRRRANPNIRCLNVPNHTIQCDVGAVVQKRDYAPRATVEFIRMCREAARPSISPKT